MKKKWIVLGVIAILLLAVGAHGLWIRVLSRTDFDQQAWLAGNTRARGRMVHDLMQRKLLDGKTRSEVIALLGAPNDSSAGSLGYTVDIGHSIGSFPWTYRLDVRLNKADGVEDYTLLD